MFNEFRISLILLALLTLLTGALYPLATYHIGQSFFHKQAEGSLIEANGQIIGSTLLGQSFAGPGYFHARPSAAGSGYDAGNSSGSNFGPTSAELAKALSQRLDDLKQNNNPSAPPVDLVTASGSGLDPDISPAAAYYQAMRVAAARHLDVSAVNQLIIDAIQPPTFGFLGEDRVNVLRLNMALDKLATAPHA